jgi:hypothetical protein
MMLSESYFRFVPSEIQGRRKLNVPFAFLVVKLAEGQGLATQASEGVPDSQVSSYRSFAPPSQPISRPQSSSVRRVLTLTLSPPLLSPTRIQAEAMGEQDANFTAIEEYASMTIQQLQTSKIGKVMRKIAALSDIPRDDEFKFRERANTLMTKVRLSRTLPLRGSLRFLELTSSRVFFFLPLPSLFFLHLPPPPCIISSCPSLSYLFSYTIRTSLHPL